MCGNCALLVLRGLVGESERELKPSGECRLGRGRERKGWDDGPAVAFALRWSELELAPDEVLPGHGPPAGASSGEREGEEEGEACRCAGKAGNGKGELGRED